MTGNEETTGAARGEAAVTLHLPAPLRELVGGTARVRLAGRPATVGEALAALREDHPAVHARLITEQGELREHINVFVGRENVRHTGGLDTPLSEGAEVQVIPAVSGG